MVECMSENAPEAISDNTKDKIFLGGGGGGGGGSPQTPLKDCVHSPLFLLQNTTSTPLKMLSK